MSDIGLIPPVVGNSLAVRRYDVRFIPGSGHRDRWHLRRYHYRLAQRALELVAVRVRRSPTGSGRAWLWRLRNSEGE